MPAAEPGLEARWFSDAVQRLLPELLGTALRLTRNRADAEDLVADAVARAWVARGSLERRERFRGWVFRILTNAFLSGRRRAAVHPSPEPLEEHAEAEAFSLFERLHQPFLLWWSNPERTFFDKLLREDLERAIDALPDVFRVVVIMVDVEGWSYQDVAAALGVPVGTVRSRLARGRSALQRRLWEQARDMGVIATPQRAPRPGDGQEDSSCPC
ncbi:MAG: RNA polymerase sigma factor [Gemmatimonadales bacterium]